MDKAVMERGTAAAKKWQPSQIVILLDIVFHRTQL